MSHSSHGTAHHRPHGSSGAPQAGTSAAGTAPQVRERDIHVVDQAEMKKALRATLLGNFMEWFDIGVFAYVMTYIALVFFPALPAPWDNLATFLTLAVTFLVRPLGGLVLGPIGDKVGRRKVLAFTIIMMSVGTFLIGCIPGYATIGWVAPVLLILLKFIQGFSTGGEYAGAATFIAEYSSDRRRGFWGSFLDLGSYLGFAAAATLATVVELVGGEQFMQTWGWRLCFWIALPLGLVGLYMRSHISESHAFEAQMDADQQKGETSGTGIGGELKTVVARHWRHLLIGGAMVMCAQVVGYALTTYMPDYLSTVLGYDTLHGNALLVPVLIIASLGLPVFGAVSDRIGRRPVMLAGCVIGIVGAIPAFLLMMMGHTWSTFLGLLVVGFIMMFQVSVQASALPSLFPTPVRYTAMGIMFNVAVALFGGTTGFVISGLQNLFHSELMGAYYIMFACVIGAVGVLASRESSGRNLEGSMPAVEDEAEAREVAETIHQNQKYDLSTMPIDIVGGKGTKKQGAKK